MRFQQNESGPCGLFAVLQAHVLRAKEKNSNYANEVLLIEAASNLMETLHKAYVFCLQQIEEEKMLVLYHTTNRDVAERFVQENGFFELPNAMILLEISLTYLAGPGLLNAFATPSPLISEDGMTDLQFVVLLLTGRVVDTYGESPKVASGMILGAVGEKQDIGFLVADEAELQDHVGLCFTNPLSNVWVAHSGNHFYVLRYADPDIQIFDNMDKQDHEWRPMKPAHPLYDTVHSVVVSRAPSKGARGTRH